MAKLEGFPLGTGDMAEVEALAGRGGAATPLPCRPGFAAASAAGDGLEWFGVRAGSELRAAVPLVRRRMQAGMTALHSPLFAPFGGFLASIEPKELDALRRERFWRETFEALDGVVREAADRVEMILPPGVDDLRGLSWGGWQARPHYNYVSRWDAPGAWAEAIDSTVRRQARKAREGGLEIRVEEASRTEALAELWRRNAAKQKLDASLDRNIASIGAWLSAERCGFAAEVLGANGACESAGLFGWDGARVYYLAGASDPEALGSGAPTLLHVAVMEEIDRRGLPRCYDWVGANTPSVAQFKRKFGPELEVLFAARHESRKAKLASAAKGLLR